jgi:Tol biopolymer transport system component
MRKRSVSVALVAALALGGAGVGAAAEISTSGGGGRVLQIRPLTGTYEDTEYGTWSSSPLAVSPNGRFVLYRFQGGSAPAVMFVRDLETGTERHVDGLGTLGGLPHAISDDGRYLLYGSAADLTEGETGGTMDLYRRDLVGGTVARVSVVSADAPAHQVGAYGAMGNDGRYAAFFTQGGDNEAGPTDPRYYVRDMIAGETTRIGVDSAGEPIHGFRLDAMSDDGSVVAYVDTVDDWPDGFRAIVRVWDRATGTAVQISPDVVIEGGGYVGVGSPDMSGDGRFVTFQFGTRVLVYDRHSQTTTDAAVTTAGLPLDTTTMGAETPQISADGRYVVFKSASSELVPGDTNAERDVFLRDLWSERTLRVNLDPGGAQSGGSRAATGGYYELKVLGVSADSGRVVFISSAADLVDPWEANWDTDVFVRSFSAGEFAPETSLSTGLSGAVTTRTSTLSFTSPWATTFECRLDAAAWAACTSPVTTPSLPDGGHTFDVRAVHGDQADATPATRTWVIDTLAPNTSLTAGPSGWISDRTPTFAFNASEPGATFACKVDTASWAACTSPRTTASLGGGAHTFAVRATDAVGQADLTPGVRNFVVDYTRPNTRITAGPGATTRDRTPTLKFTASQSRSTFKCRIDKGSWSTCTSGWTTKRLTKGKHVLAVRATDRAGNVDLSPATRTTIVR